LGFWALTNNDNSIYYLLFKSTANKGVTEIVESACREVSPLLTWMHETPPRPNKMAEEHLCSSAMRLKNLP
jgi:hypothetical protein